LPASLWILHVQKSRSLKHRSHFLRPDTPPPFIIPITETPSPNAGLPSQITDTPIPAAPSEKWWEVYFTDPLTTSNPDFIAGSIEEKLIQFINNAQVSIHIASFEFNLTPVANALIDCKESWCRREVDN